RDPGAARPALAVRRRRRCDERREREGEKEMPHADVVRRPKRSEKEEPDAGREGERDPAPAIRNGAEKGGDEKAQRDFRRQRDGEVERRALARDLPHEVVDVRAGAALKDDGKSADGEVACRTKGAAESEGRVEGPRRAPS